MEILIYVGAVCVTIVFGVMLSEPDEPAREGKPASRAAWATGAALIAAGIFWGIALLSLNGPWSTPVERVTDGSIAAIGLSLLTTYSMAFELISLVLLVAILGALVIARSGRARG
jgi:NADH-quinone oxidoreductase subunit J